MSTATTPASVPKAKPNFIRSSGAVDPLGLNPLDRRFWAVEMTASAKQAQRKIHDASPGLLVLAMRVAALNPDAGGIGPGMLASLVEDARALLLQAGSPKTWNEGGAA